MIKTILKILSGLLLLVVLGVAIVGNLSKPKPQNMYDVAIVERSIELLRDESDWLRNDDRICTEDKQQLSIYCALKQASIEIAGNFEHNAASLDAVREEIKRQIPNEKFEHILMDYNNNAEIDFNEMHYVLELSVLYLRNNAIRGQ